MLFNLSPPYRHPLRGTSRAKFQRGAAVIATSLLTLAVASAALGSFLLQRSKQAQTHALEQQAALSWAHQAVHGFAAVHGRLPCPATVRAGAEVCEGGIEKGWLPLESLLATVQASISPVQAHLAMRYMVNRAAAWGEPSSHQPADVGSGTDLCARLESTAGFEPPWRSSGGVAPQSGALLSPSHVLYGIAVAAVGAPDAASGINADFNVALLESPSRSTDPLYQDKVIFTTPAAFHEEAGCSGAAASLSTMALASAWVDDAASSRRSNIEKADRTADMIDLGVMSDGFYLVDSGLDLVNGIYNAADNAAKATTAAPNPALAAFVPVHVGGIGKAAIGIGLSTVDTARNAVTLAVRTLQAKAFRDMSKAAAEQRVWEGSEQILLKAREVGLAARLSPLTSLHAVER